MLLNDPSFKKLDEIVIILIGQSGSGKTTFIKLLTGNDDLQVDPDYDCTAQIREVYYDGERRLTFVDTPGFCGETLEDDNIVKLITDFCDRQKRPPTFIFCHSIRQPRYNRLSQQSFRLAQRIRSPPINMILVTTQWESRNTLAYPKQEHLHQQLSKDKWKVWIARGRPLHPMKDETRAAAEEIVRSLFQNEIRLRRIQGRLAGQPEDNLNQQQAVRNLRKDLKKQLASAKGGHNNSERSDVEAELRLLNSYAPPSKLSSFWSSLFG